MCLAQRGKRRLGRQKDLVRNFQLRRGDVPGDEVSRVWSRLDDNATKEFVRSYLVAKKKSSGERHT